MLDQATVESHKTNNIRLARFLKEDMEKIVKTNNSVNDDEELYLYNGKNYDRLTDNRLRSLISEFMTKYDIEKRFTSSNVLNIILALKHIPDVPIVEMDKDRNLLNVANGILNVEKLELTPHSDETYLSYCMDVEYDQEQTDCPNFISFLQTTFTLDDGTPDNDTILNMLMIGGYLLYPTNTMQMMFIFLGNGANGKSVYLDTITSFFPEKYTTGLSLKRLSSDEGFGRSEIKNSRLNIATETKGGDKKVDSEELKKMISNEKITLSQKHIPDVTMAVQTKFALASNDRPYFNDTSKGAWRRFFFVEFKNMFVDEWEYPQYKDAEKYRIYKKKDYMKLFEEEKTAIFNLLLASVHQLKKSSWQLEKSKNTIDIEEEYKETADPVATFLKETYEIANKDGDSFDVPMTFQEIYSDYEIYYSHNYGSDTKFLMKKNNFGGKIRTHFRIKPNVIRKRDSNGKPTTETSYNLKYKSDENEDENNKIPELEI